MNRKRDIFLNRDLSWLEFNARVLDEAADRSTPLLERLKFIAIFSGNLDEFYMVRVAGSTGNDALSLRLEKRIRTLVTRQTRLFMDELLPQLEEHGIRIRSREQLSSLEQAELRRKFISDILPVLTPIGIDPAQPVPVITNLGLELLIRVRRQGDKKDRFAILEVPGGLPRFLVAEERGGQQELLPLESVIAGNLDLLFNGCRIIECKPFRITRDMNFSIEEDASADLLTEMRAALQKNAKRRVIRLEIPSDMSLFSRKWLYNILNVPENGVFPTKGLLNLKSCFQLTSAGRAELKYPEMPPLRSIHLSEKKSIFQSIREEGSFLVHHPYESFEPVIRFLEEAAADPDVLAIKQTLYRVSGNSPVVEALMKAARKGKQVTVLVELKARFDEENNINWALELDRAGAHVVYGVANLKVHCKTLLVVRREHDGIHRYMHIGTGNYNDKTARQYTDLGLFTDDKAIAADCTSLFNVITGFSIPPVWNKLLVAPFNLLERILHLIDREAALSTAQNPGSIRIKANAVIDPEVMEHLVSAAKKNVRIELAIRGICGINPQALPKKFAKNITVISILDRFLEHSRIYRFGNNGMPEYYIGSSDLMQRNLHRRIEVLVPVEKEENRRELDMILNTVLSDRRKGRRLIGGYRYTRTCTRMEQYEKTRAQTALYEFYKKRLLKQRKTNPHGQTLDIFHSPDRTEQKGTAF